MRVYFEKRNLEASESRSTHAWTACVFVALWLIGFSGLIINT